MRLHWLARSLVALCILPSTASATTNPSNYGGDEDTNRDYLGNRASIEHGSLGWAAGTTDEITLMRVAVQANWDGDQTATLC